MARFQDRVVIVTGGGRGIGAALAEGFAREGARVVVGDIAAAEATAARIEAAGGRAKAVHLDVTDPESCRAAVTTARSAYGPVGVLVNNAGILIRDPFGTGRAGDAFRRTFDVNLHGAVNMSEAALADLTPAGGAILNIASIQSFAALRNAVAYTASKAAIAQFTKALAVDLAPQGVRVNALAPGIIETEISAVTRNDPERLAKFLERVPMGRCGTVADLVEPALFLCSPAAAYVTGAILPVDGGFLAL